MLDKRMVVFFCVVPMLLVSGCVATLGKNNTSENQRLRSRVSDLENQLMIKNEEIDSLKDAVSSKSYVQRSPVTEVKSRPNSRQIQRALKNAGYYAGAIDGKIGKQTIKAIKKFQKDNGLKADGKVGKRTWSILGGYLN